jgi:cytochrome c-type biogenesis protein CcmF
MLVPWAGFALGVGIAAYFLAPQSPWKVAAGIAGSAWVLTGTLRFLWTRVRANGARFTPEMLGMTFAHFGIAVFLIGALLVEGLSQQRELAVAPGQQVTLGAYAFRFDGVARSEGPNYIADTGTVTVFHRDAPLAVMHPEKRRYAAGGQIMTEAAIQPGLQRDLYVALGEPLGGGNWAVRVHVKPFVRCIWLGAVLMALGGFITATDRRFRRRETTA